MAKATYSQFWYDLKNASSKQELCSILFTYLRAKGQSNYDESVTQYEHAVQAAALAQEDQASSSSVVAALFHDMGHMIADEENAQADFLKEDLFHEAIGAQYLALVFPPSVVDPIRLHVPAKRYLCTVDPSYHEGLSSASKRSFQLQGGVFSDQELSEFTQEPHWEAAVQLRKWDDLAKVREKGVPEVETYQEVVMEVLAEPPYDALSTNSFQ